MLVAVHVLGAVPLARWESTSFPIWESPSRASPHDKAGLTWFELQGLVNTRDIPVLHHLHLVVRGARQHTKGPVTVFTGQMGMIAYFLAVRRDLADAIGLPKPVDIDFPMLLGRTRTNQQPRTHTPR